jgi:hypothetical protein
VTSSLFLAEGHPSRRLSYVENKPWRCRDRTASGPGKRAFGQQSRVVSSSLRQETKNDELGLRAHVNPSVHHRRNREFNPERHAVATTRLGTVVQLSGDVAGIVGVQDGGNETCKGVLRSIDGPEDAVC